MLSQYVKRHGAANVVNVGPLDRDLVHVLREQKVTDLHVIVGGWHVESRENMEIPSRFHAHKLKESLGRTVRVHVLAIFSAANPPRRKEISTWAKVSLATSPGLLKPFNTPVVPHIVRNTRADAPPWTLVGPNLRDKLGIPTNATVFCRHGGAASFDMLATHAAIKRVARDRPDIWFVFQNTNRFANASNIIHLTGHMEREDLPTFIRTCDAMVHGRQLGEEFGLAIAEFGIMQKPVVTCPPSQSTLYGIWGKGSFHLMALGEVAFRYGSATRLEQILKRFDRTQARAQGAYWNVWKSFAPEHVMRTFDCVHLRGGRCQQKTLPEDDGTSEVPTQPSTEGGALTNPCDRCSDYVSVYAERFGSKAKRAYLEGTKHFK